MEDYDDERASSGTSTFLRPHDWCNQAAIRHTLGTSLVSQNCGAAVASDQNMISSTSQFCVATAFLRFLVILVVIPNTPAPTTHHHIVTTKCSGNHGRFQRSEHAMGVSEAGLEGSPARNTNGTESPHTDHRPEHSDEGREQRNTRHHSRPHLHHTNHASRIAQHT